MNMLEWVMLTLWVALAGAAVLAWRIQNDRRDVQLLAGLATLWGMGTAAVVAL